MNATQFIAVIQSGLNLGLTAAEIARRICADHSGQAVPTLKEFEARVDSLRELPDLSKLSGHIIMATRWAVDDLTGIVAKNNPRARLLSFPAINGGGQPLVPELHPLDKLLETKASLSPSQWSALYQQSPVQDGGNIFQEAWFRRWNLGNLPESFLM